tara:strand:- start:1125 stop:1688 length:564 start_codon:yes stop_codon:yes gene_type:complete
VSSNNQASTLVCRRYANALITQAENEKKLDKVEKDLKDLSAMIDSSDDLRAVIRSPLLSKEKLHSAISAIAKKAKLQDVTQNFLGTLIENTRLNALEKTISAFDQVLSERRGELKVNVQVAQDITAKQKKDLEAALSKALGGEVSANVSVEPSILGGMVVTVGSKMIDASVANKMARLRSTLGGKAA